MHVLKERFSPIDGSESIHQRRATGAQRLHFGSAQDHSGLVNIFDVIVVTRFAIGGDYFNATFPRHD
jgi:hypothetical protein